MPSFSGKDYTSDALSPVSPASATSGYKSEPSFDRMFYNLLAIVYSLKNTAQYLSIFSH